MLALLFGYRLGAQRPKTHFRCDQWLDGGLGRNRHDSMPEICGLFSGAQGRIVSVRVIDGGFAFEGSR